MKKVLVLRVIKILVFCFIFSWLFVHVTYMVRPELAHTRNNVSGFYDEKKDSLDVVFIGTSGTFSAFAPMEAWEEYGFTSYNFCVNVMAVETMPYAVKEALKYQHPKVMVIDVYPFIFGYTMEKFEDFQLRYNTDGWKITPLRYSMIREIVPEDVDKLPLYFDMVKYHANHFNWNNFWGNYHNVDKGFNFLPYGVAEPAVLTEEEMILSESFEAALSRLLRVCKEANTEVLFIYYPYGKRGEHDMGNVNYIQKRVEESGFSFLNCERIVGQFAMDYNRDYWNAGHFNIYGAEKITRVVGKYLQDTYHLEDRREDEAYASWNEDLRIWHMGLAAKKAEIDKAIVDAQGQ